MAISQELRTPQLLGDCRTSIDQFRLTAEIDTAAIQEKVTADDRLYRDFLDCNISLQTEVPGRELEAERTDLLAQLLKDLPEIDDSPMPNSADEIACRVRKNIMIAASRPNLFFARCHDRTLVGERHKLNASGTVQKFVEYQIQVDDDIRAEKTDRTTIDLNNRRGRYWSTTSVTEQVTSRHDVATTEKLLVTERVLVGAKQLDLNAPIASPPRVSEFIAKSNSLLAGQFRLVTGGLCDYRESEEVLRNYDHCVKQQWTEQSKSREIHYRRIAKDAAITAAVVGGAVATVAGISAIAAMAHAAVSTSLATHGAAALPAATTVLMHVDPVICWGPFALTGFLPPGYDTSHFTSE